MIGGRKWAKGQSGNPSGRPKSNFSFKKELETKLGEVDERDCLKRTHERIIIDRIVDMATKRNPSIRAISEILDRVLGKPAQALTLDANLNMTREQRVAKVEELLAALPPPKESSEPSDPRVN
jgi:Family of unknown function (DUF5681)